MGSSGDAAAVGRVGSRRSCLSCLGRDKIWQGHPEGIQLIRVRLRKVQRTLHLQLFCFYLRIPLCIYSSVVSRGYCVQTSTDIPSPLSFAPQRPIPLSGGLRRGTRTAPRVVRDRQAQFADRTLAMRLLTYVVNGVGSSGGKITFHSILSSCYLPGRFTPHRTLPIIYLSA